MALLLLASSSLFSQSFDEARTYQVPGATLNRLEGDLLTAKQELAELTQSLQTLKQQLAESRSMLAEAQTQLQTASTLLRKSESKILEDQIRVGVGGVLTGAILGAVIVAVFR